MKCNDMETTNTQNAPHRELTAKILTLALIPSVLIGFCSPFILKGADYRQYMGYLIASRLPLWADLLVPLLIGIASFGLFRALIVRPWVTQMEMVDDTQ